MHPRLRKRLVLISLLLSATLGALFFTPPRNISESPPHREESRLCACCKCVREGDPSFTKLIKASPKLFLSRNTTSEDDYTWWKGLQKEKHNFTVYNTTLDSLFQIIPSAPEVVGPAPHRCRSCAVVGNSGTLKGSNNGPLINSHEIVIRMNRCRIKGFEKDVGTKTTHHIFYPESWTQLDNSTHLVFLPFKMKDLMWFHKLLSSNKKQKSKKMVNKDLVMILNPAFMKFVHERWLGKKGRYPSTGFLAVALSLQMCDKVDVFGFGADQDGNWSHYFENLKNTRLRTGPHAGKHEYSIIQKMSKNGKIHLF